MKLNLGCDTKLIAGWLNIDIVTPKNLKTGTLFIEDDVRTLDKVDDNSADVIRAYHLLEHLTQPEGIQFLKTCHKKLKPSGMLELELPCLVKCAESLIRFNEGSFKNVPKILRGLYGLQDSREEMQHKYGYCFKTLEPELKKLGFINISEEIPTTKCRERDFRVEAYKK